MTRTDLIETDIAPARGAMVWRGERAPEGWLLHLRERDCAELLAAAEALRGRPLDAITTADMPLPGFAAMLARGRSLLEEGPGVVLLRGLPVTGIRQETVETAFWGIGAHLGIGVSQSAAGDRLGHVYDRGTGDRERYYTRGGELEFHVDPVDIVGLLCLRRARTGGASRVASAGALHNAILAERPDLLRLLYRGFRNSRRGHGQTVSPRPVPVFAAGPGGIECYLLPETIRQAVEEGHPLTEAEEEALRFLSEVANRPGMFLEMDFRPGDIQFLNNRTLLHARTDYVDHSEPERRRHLLRLWLMAPDWPPRPPAMLFHDAVDQAGGGVRPAR